MAGDPNELNSVKLALAELLNSATEQRAAMGKLETLPDITAELKQRLGEVEQLASRRGGGGGGGAGGPTWGSEVTNGPSMTAIAQFKENRVKGIIRFPVTNALTSGGGLSEAVAPSTRDTDISMLPRRRLTIRTLLNVIRVSTGSVEFARQTGRTNNAAPTAENTTKPESDLAFEMDTAPIRTIPHWVAASRQILDDSKQLGDLIDQELRYGVSLVEEEEILFGDGTGQHLDGLVAQATAYAAPAGAEVEFLTRIDTIGLALLQSMLADVEPNGVIMHPSDWMNIRLTKNADGDYIYGDPSVAIEPYIFGRPVVPTPSMTVGDFLVGDFKRAATLYDRQEVAVLISTEHADFFTKNMVAILAEERVGLAVKRPEALVTGSF